MSEGSSERKSFEHNKYEMSFTRYRITLPLSNNNTFLTIIPAKTKQFTNAMNRFFVITDEFVVLMERFSSLTEDFPAPKNYFSERKNGFSKVGDGFGVMRENFSKATDGISGAKDHFSREKNDFSVVADSFSEVKNGFSGVADDFSGVKNGFSRSGKLRKSLNNGVFYLITKLYKDKVEGCNFEFNRIENSRNKQFILCMKFLILFVIVILCLFNFLIRLRIGLRL